MKSPYLERNQKLSTTFWFSRNQKAMASPSAFLRRLSWSFIWFTCWLPRNSSKQPGEAVGPPGKVMNQRWDERYRSIIPLLFTESFLRTWNLFVFYFGSWILQKKVISGPVIVLYIYIYIYIGHTDMGVLRLYYRPPKTTCKRTLGRGKTSTQTIIYCAFHVVFFRGVIVYIGAPRCLLTFVYMAGAFETRAAGGCGRHGRLDVWGPTQLDGWVVMVPIGWELCFVFEHGFIYLFIYPAFCIGLTWIYQL